MTTTSTSTSTSTRALILDAFESIVIDSGERTATLDAVAKRAGVSKGGLLYHFASKNDLVDGEIQRLTTLAEEEVAELIAAPDGMVSRFMRLSVAENTPLDRAFTIASRLAQSGQYPGIIAALETVESSWLRMLTDALGDPVVARIVMLMSDGLYYRSALFPSKENVTPDTDELLVAVDQLIAARSPH
jgi:AcrR family transcriptional regulator